MAQGSLTKERIRGSLGTSLGMLKTGKVRTLYCHLPDKVTGLKETVETMDELWKEGKFENVCSPSTVHYIVVLLRASFFSPLNH